MTSIENAKIMYLDYFGYFVANVHLFSDTVVIESTSPISVGSLVRDFINSAKYHVSDHPISGFWSLNKGVIVVPRNQFNEITWSRKAHDFSLMKPQLDFRKSRISSQPFGKAVKP